MTKPSELGAGEWDALWDAMKEAALMLPCPAHREAMARCATVREYLLSLPGGEPRDDRDIMAGPARSYLCDSPVMRNWKELVPERVLLKDWSRAFTLAEVDRVLAALRRRLDAACQPSTW